VSSAKITITDNEKLPITYYRVDNIDFCMNWKEHCRANTRFDAEILRDLYERTYGCWPTRIRKVIETKVTEEDE
jgi:hypothetical protein